MVLRLWLIKGLLLTIIYLCLQVQELACECLISLTHHQHNPQWLRHQLRLLGGLDLVANLGRLIVASYLRESTSVWSLCVLVVDTAPVLNF